MLMLVRRIVTGSMYILELLSTYPTKYLKVETVQLEWQLGKIQFVFRILYFCIYQGGMTAQELVFF